MSLALYVLFNHYVMFFLGTVNSGIAKKTAVVKSELNPVWNEV